MQSLIASYNKEKVQQCENGAREKLLGTETLHRKQLIKQHQTTRITLQHNESDLIPTIDLRETPSPDTTTSIREFNTSRNSDDYMSSHENQSPNTPGIASLIIASNSGLWQNSQTFGPAGETHRPYVNKNPSS